MTSRLGGEGFDPRDHAVLRRLFDVLCDLPYGDRDALMDRHCAGRPALRRQLESLLARDERPPAGQDPLATGAWIAGQEISRLGAEALHAGTERLPRIDGLRILSRAGEGGMGVVYRAFQPILDREVAVKVLRSAMPTREQQERFRREIQVLARLEGDGIAAIHGAGVTCVGHVELPYFVMEWIDGPDIVVHARREGCDIPARLELLAKVAEAVAQVHRAGVVHRDIKPSNVLVDGRGQPRLIDFGVARLIDPDASVAGPRTASGHLLGTLAYMSPEQAAGGKPGPASDVYALGLLIHEVVSGRLPYDLDGLPAEQALRTIREHEPDRADPGWSTWPPGLAALLSAALAKDPSDRPRSAAELADGLRRIREGRPLPDVAAATATGKRRGPARVALLVAAPVIAVIVAQSAGFPPRLDHSGDPTTPSPGGQSDPVAALTPPEAAMVAPVVSSALASLLAVGGTPLQAVPLEELVSPLAEQDDVMGTSVALDGDTLAIGVPGHQVQTTAEGRVLVYVRDGPGWSLQASLTASDGLGFDAFGSGVALEGDRLVVAARSHDHAGLTAGGAYLFERQGTVWGEVCELVPANLGANDGFGDSVAVSGDWIAVGATHTDHGHGNEGSVYLFERTGAGCVERQEVVAGDAGEDDFFGSAVDLSGDRLLVGAMLHDHGGVDDTGGAYLFVLDAGSWIPEAELLPGDVAARDELGLAVALDGDVAVVAARIHAHPHLKQGAAWVFRRDSGGWHEEQELLAPDPLPGDQFGRSVDVQGSLVLCGAPRTQAGDGLAHVFGESGGVWVHIDALQPCDQSAQDDFGKAVSLSGSRMAVGAPSDTSGGPSASGAVTVGELLGTSQWMDLGNALHCAHAPRLEGAGDLLPGSPTALELSAAPPQATAYLVIGVTAIFAPFKGGMLVPNKDVLLAVPTGLKGCFQLNAAWPAGVPVGTDVFWQVWIPDPACPGGFTATQGLQCTT